jgi:hypothetical protein
MNEKIYHYLAQQQEPLQITVTAASLELEILAANEAEDKGIDWYGHRPKVIFGSLYVDPAIIQDTLTIAGFSIVWRVGRTEEVAIIKGSAEVAYYKGVDPYAAYSKFLGDVFKSFLFYIQEQSIKDRQGYLIDAPDFRLSPEEVRTQLGNYQIQEMPLQSTRMVTNIRELTGRLNSN